MGLICYLAAGACLVYYGIIMLATGMRADSSWIWLFLAGGLTILGRVLRSAPRAQGLSSLVSILIAYAVLLAGTAFFGMQITRIALAMGGEPEGDYDYVLVLGAQVRGLVPSNALAFRLEAALDYAKAHPDSVLILTGAQGSGEDITEADCMREYLLARGIPDKRMVLEENSTSTRENLLFSAALTGCDKKRVGIVTNHFHLYRTLRIAENVGYRDAHGIAADSTRLMLPHYVARECFALVKELLATL